MAIGDATNHGINSKSVMIAVNSCKINFLCLDDHLKQSYKYFVVYCNVLLSLSAVK